MVEGNTAFCISSYTSGSSRRGDGVSIIWWNAHPTNAYGFPK